MATKEEEKLAEQEAKQQNTESTPAETTPPAGEPPAEETPPETPPAETFSGRYSDRLSKAYPDRPIANEDDYNSLMDEHLQGLEDYQSKGQAANQKLIALFEAEPQVADIIRDMMAGATFREALARHVSPEDITAVEGDPDYEGWNKNKTAREESAAKRKSFQESYTANLDQSMKDLKEIAEQDGMNEESVDNILASLDAIVNDAHEGRITKETFMLLKNGSSYAADLEAARGEGEIAGQNKKIITEKQPKKEGDGLPRPQKGGETPVEKKPNVIEGVVNNFNQRQRF